MERLNFVTASPAAYKAWLALERFINESAIEKPLAELVRLRASQINGCAFCVDMHARDAAEGGESARRLYAVTAWRDTLFFSPRERAALAWTEALTRIADHPALDAAFEDLRAHFSETDMVDLTLLINTINGWNRMAIGFGKMPPL